MNAWYVSNEISLFYVVWSPKEALTLSLISRSLFSAKAVNSFRHLECRIISLLWWNLMPWNNWWELVENRLLLGTSTAQSLHIEQMLLLNVYFDSSSGFLLFHYFLLRSYFIQHSLFLLSTVNSWFYEYLLLPFAFIVCQ